MFGGSPSLMFLEHHWALEPTRNALASWLKYSDNRIFHISGKPRSGKMQMVYYIAHSEVAREHLQTWCKTKRLTQTIVFFRRTDGTRETSCEWNLQAVLRAIYWSLIVDKPELAPRLFPRQCDSYPRGFHDPCVINDEEVLHAWNRLVTLDDIYTDDKFVLYLDGLSHFKQGFSRMLDHLKQWMSARPLDVKICISSRGQAEFQEGLKAYPGFIMHEVSQADMLWYIRWALLHEDEDWGARFVRNTSPLEREELEQHFLAKVNDMTSRSAIKGFVDDWMQQYEQGTLNDYFDRQLLRESYQDDPPELPRV
ncbi:uncharacterized protein BO72DRAFT_521876 [Aspergillus fijiensis CBS 313.89]|uniref:Nephrocystin 3-like N-terminal domain-containing protein n=1 Tax=Aspergillus fijiensis CBS 313.89 TaxID=1448319 RepID=A0A8G1RFP5_9EURO|nr:uncharacterized protein BO72DRAFT_521876 [Aspergillus fijiensis CBS 313.89]RAK72029.1 hypothetical protein BO72DRAFT_521876 [Aspergillus fijiensis CBS 313.89]